MEDKSHNKRAAARARCGSFPDQEVTIWNESTNDHAAHVRFWPLADMSLCATLLADEVIE